MKLHQQAIWQVHANGPYNHISIGKIFKASLREQHATFIIVLELSPLGDEAQIELTLLARASKEGYFV